MSDRRRDDRTGTHAAGRARQARVLWRAVAVLAVVLVAEVVGGLVSGSLALLSDAGHVLTDLVGVAGALVAVRAAQRVELGGRRSFGLHRLEVLAAAVNAVLLIGVAVWVLVEAISRLGSPPEVRTGPMLTVAVLGLLGNLLVMRWFRQLDEGDADRSMHVEGARLEVLADTLGSVAVIVGAGIVAVTGWDVVDPVLGVLIGLFVLPRAVSLGARAMRVLLQLAPEGVDLDAAEAELAALPTVARVHDLHAWTLTSGIDVASVHLTCTRALEPAAHHDLLDRAHRVLRGHGLDHATVQLEPPAHVGCDPHADWSAPRGHAH